MQEKKPTKIELPYLALCEGSADKATFERLIKANGLAENTFQFEHPAEFTAGSGKDAFYNVLLGLPLRLSEKENFKGIILLRDTDDNHEKALRELKKQVERANKNTDPEFIFTAPNSFLTPSIGGTYPILFASIPFDKPGCLETLILPAVEKAFIKQAACINTYIQCCGNICDWSKTKQDKMRLACLVATICEKDPTITISSMWSKKEFEDLLTDQDCFGELISFFKNIEKHFDKNIFVEHKQLDPDNIS